MPGLTPIKRTGSYPLQTSDLSPFNGPPVEIDDKQERLPRTIRALRDSRKHQSHPRTLVICLDGTGDRFDGDNSNIVHFVSCLKKHDPVDQVTYYQSGIGTYDQGGVQNGFGAAMDMAVGSGLGKFPDARHACFLGLNSHTRYAHQRCIQVSYAELPRRRQDLFVRILARSLYYSLSCWHDSKDWAPAC